MLGRHAQAQALIGRTPLDCYHCVRVRGLVARRDGDPAAAQRWFAGRPGSPSLPAAFSDWGKLLLDARRYPSAEVKLREASRLAPNWADPLKSWGDLLAAQGKREEALAKYDAALKLAPKWVGLRKARDAVAARRPSKTNQSSTGNVLLGRLAATASRAFRNTTHFGASLSAASYLANASSRFPCMAQVAPGLERVGPIGASRDASRSLTSAEG